MKWLNGLMRLMAETCSMSDGKEFTPELVKSYATLLCDLNQDQLTYGCREAAKNSVFFPAVALIRQYAEQMPMPEDIQQRSSERYNRMVAEYVRRGKADLAEMVARVRAGKSRIPEVGNVDEFNEAVSQLSDMNRPNKSLHESQHAAALARLGGSTMPTDPAARQEWASQMAVKNGWKTREAGEEG